MAYTLNRRLAQLVDSNGQLNTGKIPNDYITSDHVADNSITSAMLHTSFTVAASNLTSIDTDDVSEGLTNLYYTDARADARIAAATTDDLSEGSTNLYFTNARIDSHLSGGTGVTYSSGAISIGQDVGTTATPTFGNITTTGYIAGPATFTIDPAAVGDNTGTVVIAGNLQVDGTTTTINSTTVNVDDLNIQLATGAANAAAADGAGITVDCGSDTDATFTYDGTNDRFDFNKAIEIGSGYGGTPNTDSQLIINDSGNNYITIGSGATSEGGILFADSADNDVGIISYNHNTDILSVTAPNGIQFNDKLHIVASDPVTNQTLVEFLNSSGYGIYARTNSIGARGNTLEFIASDYNNNSAQTHNVLALRPEGNVGIGTDTPQRILTVTGSADSPSDNTGILSITDGTGVNTDAKMQFGITSNGHGYIHTVKPGTDIKSLLLAPAGGSGKVGIGISSTPSAKLHIQPSNSDTLENAIYTRQNNAAGTDGNTFVLRNDAANNFVEMNSGGTNNGGYKFYRGNFSGDPALTIVGAGVTGGYVGIGTETPQTLLETATTGTTTNRLTVSSANEFSQIWVEDNDIQGILWKDGSDFTFGPAADVSGNGWGPYITIKDGGNIGIGTDTPTGSGKILHFNSSSNVADFHVTNSVTGATSTDGFILRVTDPADVEYINREGATTDQIWYQGSTRVMSLRASSGNVAIGSHNPASKLHILGPGGGTTTDLRICSPDNNTSRLTVAEDPTGDRHGAFFEYKGNDLDKTQIGVINDYTESNLIMFRDNTYAGFGSNLTNPLQNLVVGTTTNYDPPGLGNTNANFAILKRDASSSGDYGMITGISSDGNVWSQVQRTDGTATAYNLYLQPSGGSVGIGIPQNHTFIPNLIYPFRVGKQRSGTGNVTDYLSKIAIDGLGYGGSNYQMAAIDFTGGDTASKSGNLYGRIGCSSMNGANNSEEGSLEFFVRAPGYSMETSEAMKICGKAGTSIAGSGNSRNGVLFPFQGIAIDRTWANYPGIAVGNSSHYSSSSSTQAEFRFHGANFSSDSYPGTSGSDFSVNVRTDGSFISTSDGRAKTDITTIDNALEKVNQITGKRFQRINRENEPQEHLSKNGYKFGFIAQEIEDIIPEAVQYHADEDDGTENWNSAYAMDYGSVVALLVNAIKEQDVVIQDLKSRIETLEG